LKVFNSGYLQVKSFVRSIWQLTFSATFKNVLVFVSKRFKSPIASATPSYIVGALQVTGFSILWVGAF
jgi:hypothetical protein